MARQDGGGAGLGEPPHMCPELANSVLLLWCDCKVGTAPLLGPLPQLQSSQNSGLLTAGLDSATLVAHMLFRDPGVQGSDPASSSLPPGPLQTAVTDEPLQPVTLARPQVWLQGSPHPPQLLPSLFLPFLPPPPSPELHLLRTAPPSCAGHIP